MTRVIHTVIAIFLFLVIPVRAQQLKWSSYDIFLGDTVNRIEKNSLKQGRWVLLGKDKHGKKYRLYKNNQIVEDGYYENDKKTRTWKTYHNSGKLKSEITYVNDEPNGTAKFYNTEGKLIAEGNMKGNEFTGPYTIYDEKGNAFKKNAARKDKIAYLDFGGTIEKFGKSLDNVKIVVERNDVEVFEIVNESSGQFALKLELNFEYLVHFTKEGYNDQTLEINTNVFNLYDTAVYVLHNWKINLSDNLANSLSSDLFSLLLNRPSGKIYFNKRKKKFSSDGAYINLFTKQFKGISESTKFLLAQAADDNKKLEIENLRIEAEKKMNEINLLKQAQELKEAEIRKKEAEILTEKLEREKKEKEFEIAQQDKKIKELKYEQQQAELEKKDLEAQRNAKELERLAILKRVQDYELKEKQKALKVSNIQLSVSKSENEKKAALLNIAKKEKALKDLEIKQHQIYMYVLGGGTLLVSLFAFFVYKNFREKKKANLLLERQAKEINLQKHELEIKSKLIEQKNLETEQSIQYARRIQNAILPPDEEISQYLQDYFILYKSKDIVSGDFYFFSDRHADEGTVIIASVDCTGHGVPGAFMSMIGNEKLKEAVEENQSPSKILNGLNKGVKLALHQSSDANATRDGMDLCLCAIPVKQQGPVTKVRYAGANRPLWVAKKNTDEITEVKATKVAIGGLTKDDQEFEEHVLELQSGDTIYLFSDGYADQFGGPKKKKLMTGKFKDILQSLQHLNMKEQKKALEDFMNEWMIGSEQVDDILVIGVKIT